MKGTDSVVKNGINTQVSTNLQCITAMNQYSQEGKSVEVCADYSSLILQQEARLSLCQYSMFSHS